MNNRQASWAKVLAGFLCFVVSLGTHPAELDSIEVDQEEGRYMLRSVTWFDTDQEDLFAVLIDYEQYHIKRALRRGSARAAKHISHVFATEFDHWH